MVGAQWIVIEWTYKKQVNQYPAYSKWSVKVSCIFGKAHLPLKWPLGPSPVKSCNSASSESVKAILPAFPPASSLGPALSVNRLTHVDHVHEVGARSTYSYPVLQMRRLKAKWQELGFGLCSSSLPRSCSNQYQVLLEENPAHPSTSDVTAQPEYPTMHTVGAPFMPSEGNRWVQRTRGQRAAALSSLTRGRWGRNLLTPRSLCQGRRQESILVQGPPKDANFRPVFTTFLRLDWNGFCDFEWGLCWL